MYLEEDMNQLSEDDTNIEFTQTKLMEDLVALLPKIRRRLGISQTELGERVGLSRQTISSIERRKVQLTWNNYLALMMFVTANSSDVFYFPRHGEYHYSDDFKKIMVVNNEK